MEATLILDKLAELGVQVSTSNGELVLKPGSRVPPGLVPELKEHKAEIMAYLAAKGRSHRLKYYDDVVTTQAEAAEIAALVIERGSVLLWSEVLCDTIAFYRDDEALAQIPPGFVPYSSEELFHLFGDDRTPSGQHLRLIHAVKKAAQARVVGREP